MIELREGDIIDGWTIDSLVPEPWVEDGVDTYKHHIGLYVCNEELECIAIFLHVKEATIENLKKAIDENMAARKKLYAKEFNL